MQATETLTVGMSAAEMHQIEMAVRMQISYFEDQAQNGTLASLRHQDSVSLERNKQILEKLLRFDHRTNAILEGVAK